MRIFITGASGFIGSHTARRMLAQGHAVAVLLRNPVGAPAISDLMASLTPIRGDLGDLSALAGPLADFAPDTVVHCAWDGVAGAERNHPRQLANFQQAMDLVDLAARAGAKAWVGLGSQAEYGSRHTRLPAEDGPAQPETLYGAVKLSVCHAAGVLARQKGLRFAWARVFSTFGPGDAEHWMIPSLILALLKGERPALTAGGQIWDYLPVHDAAAAICHLAETVSCSGVYNLGSGRGRSLRSMIEAIRDRIAPTLPLGFGEIPYRPDQVMHLEADIARLRQSGWTPCTDFDTAIAETVEWYRHRLPLAD